MSFTLPSSPRLDREINDARLDDGTGAPGSHARSTRHARKLQLRSAGFRAPAVPTRIVTPLSPSGSTGWSANAEGEGLSGAENVPPGGKDVRTPSSGRRVGSAVLLDIGNATVTRRKKARPRMSEGALSEEEEGRLYSGVAVTPGVVKRGVRSGTAKAKARFSQRRRSASAETSKYIEHLETELATAQAQVSRLNSPSTTRKQTTHIRNIDAEREILQREIDDWEAKYEQRIQEEVDRHREIETGLRSRIRLLEQDSEESHFRIQELQVRMESTTQSMNAVEAANVNLERRIEIMSELLAASPSKIDLHAEFPGRGRRHVRPKSMLPRFPTASSLLGSPERQPQTQPTSPLMSFANYSPHNPSSPAQSVCRLDITSQHSDYMSEAESVFSEASATGDSMTSAETFDPSTSFNPWTLPPPPLTSRVRPVRRMRRFGAGSLGPKPLILPSTAHCDSLPPVSAPALERSETVPAMFTEQSSSSERSDRPLLGRRRASTMANGEDLAAHANTTSFFAEEYHVQEDETLMHFAAPSSSPASRPVTRDLSSFGSVRGRNLMDELAAVCTTQSGVTSDYAYGPLGGGSELAHEDFNARVMGRISDGTTLVQDTATIRHHSVVHEAGIESSPSPSQVHKPRETCRRSGTYQLCCSPSLVQRLRFLFGDLWNSPVDLARHLVQAAKMRMRIPRPLSTAQWWVIGVLLGPMAQRRMFTALRSASSSHINNERTLLLNSTPARATEAESLAYGSLCSTPASPTNRSPSAAHKSPAKRSVHRQGCPHRRAKHSPLVWLKFSIALAFAVGTAFKDGPAALLKTGVCSCQLADYVSRLRADEEGRGSLI